jgi:hypothetical protein
MRAFQLLVVAGVAAASTAVAQVQLQPGKYTGRMEYVNPAGKPMNDTVTLIIEKSGPEGFEGVAWDGRRNCQVDTPVQGRWDGATLKVRGKALKDGCGVSWELKTAGDALEGTGTGGKTLKLSR